MTRPAGRVGSGREVAEEVRRSDSVVEGQMVALRLFLPLVYNSDILFSPQQYYILNALPVL